MSAFDPNTIRQAVAEFSPRRPKKFHDLYPAKEVIAELRQKGASYEAVADLLTQHCLPTSKTAIAQFCHRVLGESVRPHRRSMRKRTPVPLMPVNPVRIEPPKPVAESNGTATDNAASPEPAPAAPRGPRIAQVRMIKPQNS